MGELIGRYGQRLHDTGFAGGAGLALLACQAAVGIAATLVGREDELQLNQFIDGTVVEQLRELDASVLKIAEHFRLRATGQATLGYGYNGIFDVVAGDGNEVVVEPTQVLVADGKATAADLPLLQCNLGRAEVMSHNLVVLVGSTLVAVERWQTAVGNDLDVGRMPVGKHSVAVAVLIVT